MDYVVESLRRVAASNGGRAPRGRTLDIHAAAAAIKAGLVTANWAGGRITDPMDAYALGAVSSDGPWWKAASRKTAALPTAVAGEGAYVTDSHNSGIRRDVPAGTVAHATQAYATFFGKNYDWAVDGIEGEGWQLGGSWSRQTAASRRIYAAVDRDLRDRAESFWGWDDDIPGGFVSEDGIEYQWKDDTTLASSASGATIKFRKGGQTGWEYRVGGGAWNSLPASDSGEMATVGNRRTAFRRTAGEYAGIVYFGDTGGNDSDLIAALADHYGVSEDDVEIVPVSDWDAESAKRSSGAQANGYLKLSWSDIKGWYGSVATASRRTAAENISVDDTVLVAGGPYPELVGEKGKVVEVNGTTVTVYMAGDEWDIQASDLLVDNDSGFRQRP